MKIKVRDIAQIGLNVALLAASAQITIPFGFVPFTLQVFMIYFISSIFSLRISLYSVSIYLLLGFMGLPIFSGFQGGISSLISPTVGFLFGFFFITITNHFIPTKTFKFIGSSLVLYTMGLLGLHLVFNYVLNIPLGLTESLYKYALVFIPTDAVSFYLAHALASKVQAQLNLSN